jgi:ABC-type maltose transport system permease subunit
MGKSNKWNLDNLNTFNHFNKGINTTKFTSFKTWIWTTRIEQSDLQIEFSKNIWGNCCSDREIQLVQGNYAVTQTRIWPKQKSHTQNLTSPYIVVSSTLSHYCKMSASWDDTQCQSCWDGFLKNHFKTNKPIIRWYWNSLLMAMLECVQRMACLQHWSINKCC